MLEKSNRLATNRGDRLARAASVCHTGGKVCPPERATELLESIIEPGDRVAIEGDNQKQADFLAAALAKVDPARVHDLHMVQSVLALPDHLSVFERGIASRLDFAFASPQSEARRTGRYRCPEDRRDPHLSRTLCPHAGRPDAARGARGRGQGRPRRQSLCGSKY
jgi:hypothetical protein